MATAAMIPLEEYLRTSYEHDCEWVDGELQERAMPDDDHSALQVFFIEYFAALKQELHIRSRTELRLRVGPRRYRIPDVLLMPASAPKQPIPDTPPVLCIEILSSDDRPGRVREKLADYVAMGVGAIWVVDPKRRTLATVDATGTHLVAELALPNSTVVISAAEIFAALDE